MSYERDQKRFLSHCAANLDNFYQLMIKAQESKAQAELECNLEHRKKNAGSFAANSVFLEALKEKGVEKWRV